MGDNGLPDQVSAIRQLAADRPWMDLDRWESGGIQAGDSLLPGLFCAIRIFIKSQCPAQAITTTNYEDDWGEKWQGLLRLILNRCRAADIQASQCCALTMTARLTSCSPTISKLLLAHGPGR